MMRFFYQNAGCAAGYNSFPTEALLTPELATFDGFVFNESYSFSKGYKEFTKGAQDMGFKLYKSTFTRSQNEVLIGLKSDIEVEKIIELGAIGATTMGFGKAKASEIVSQNYLCLKFNDITLIGTRTPSYSFKDKANGDKDYRKCYDAGRASFEMLLKALTRDAADDAKVILTGDFNHGRHIGKLSTTFDPKVYAGLGQRNYNLHYVFSEMDKIGFRYNEEEKDSSFGMFHLDHVFTRNVDVKTGFKPSLLDHKSIVIEVD